jgi:hypothetical protein
MEFLNWNDQVIKLLTDIKNNLNPVSPGVSEIGLKVGNASVASSNPVPISDAGGAITVDGSVQIANFPSTQQVAGTVQVSNLPATQTVTGAVQVANFPATQQVAGTVQVSSFPTTQQVAGTVQVSNLPLQYATSEDFGTDAAKLVRTGVGQVCSICGHNFSATTRYLQLHDKATQPMTGDVPKLFFPVTAGSSWLIGTDFFGVLGRRFSNGIAWAWSTTPRSFSPVATPNDHATFTNYL